MPMTPFETLAEAHPTPEPPRRLPAWLRRPLGAGPVYNRTAGAVERGRLHTICEEAKCPNRGECWSHGTATFLILGDQCTRRCAFCSVKDGAPRGVVDEGEPERLAATVAAMGLSYVVITSVDRDDLPDKGAGHFARCIAAVRASCPGIEIELLTPDFRRAQARALETLAPHGPFVFGHNVETVPRLYRAVRPGSSYADSLGLLRAAAALPGCETKTAMMLGLGERRDEVLAVMDDLRAAGTRRLVLGQYLRPTPKQTAVVEYVPPEEFDALAEAAWERGFEWVIAAPFARSSYRAESKAMPRPGRSQSEMPKAGNHA